MASEAVQVEAIAPDSPLLLAQAEDEKKDEKKDKDKKKDDKKESDKDKKDKKEEKSGGGGGLRRWLLLGGGGVLAGGVLAGGAWMFLRRRGDDDYDDELDEDGGDFDGDEVVVGEVANGEDEPTTRTVDVVGSPSSSDGKAASGERSNDSESGAIAGTVARMQDPSGSLPTRVLPPTPADRLLSELRDPSASVRRRAIWNLGERGDSRAIAPLMELLVTADSQQRSIILAVLSEIGTRILRPMERAMAISLQDSDPEVRLNAIRDLTQVYDRFAQVSRMVAYATEDEDETVQKTAKWALGKLNSLRMTSEGASEQTTEGGQSAGYNIANSEVDGALLLEQARRACDEKDYDQASTLVSEALAQDPSHPKGHLLVAEIAAAQDYPIKALIAEQQARDCAWDRGDGATAIAIQENWLAQELDPDRAALCHAQAVQALRANQTDDALGLLDEALVCNPHNPEVYMARARVLRQQGKLGEACAHWQKAQEIYLDLGDVNALRCVQQLLKRFS
ncbi:MAG: HEAT repeat domain-containing protein [Cyanobacteria bacterium P01_D01_bin.73]